MPKVRAIVLRTYSEGHLRLITGCVVLCPAHSSECPGGMPYTQRISSNK